jgi:hypothetical protein
VDLPPDPNVRPNEHHPGGTDEDDDNHNNEPVHSNEEDENNAINSDDDDIARGRPGEHSMAIIDANNIISRTYLQEPEEDGTRHRLKINADIANDPAMIRFRATNDQETFEEIVTY